MTPNIILPVCSSKAHSVVGSKSVPPLKEAPFGEPGWLSSLALPSAQGVTLETRGRVPRRAPCMEPASPSACVPASLSLSLSPSLSHELKEKKKREREKLFFTISMSLTGESGPTNVPHKERGKRGGLQWEVHLS